MPSVKRPQVNTCPRMTQDKVGDPGPGMEAANIETNLTEGGDQASHDPATWSGLAVQVSKYAMQYKWIQTLMATY